MGSRISTLEMADAACGRSDNKHSRHMLTILDNRNIAEATDVSNVLS
jgi:hypothetical protein